MLVFMFIELVFVFVTRVCCFFFRVWWLGRYFRRVGVFNVGGCWETFFFWFL